MATIKFICSNNKIIGYMKDFYVKDLQQLLFISTKNDRRDRVLNGNQQGFHFYIIKWPNRWVWGCHHN